jgi:hypothetical protein
MGDIVRATASAESEAPQANDESGPGDTSSGYEINADNNSSREDAEDGEAVTIEITPEPDPEPVTIRSTIGRTSEDWGEALLRPIRHRSALSSGAAAQESGHTTAAKRALQQRSASASALQRLRERQQEQLLLAATAQFTHQMVFDEETSVNIIENDCICSAWNELEYKF